MPAFPEPDPKGTAFVIQMWGEAGGATVTVGLPGDPDIATPAVEALVKSFAAQLAPAIDRDLASVTRFSTQGTELPLA